MARVDESPDIIAEVELLSSENGGRKGYALSGYRPAHKVSGDLLTTGHHKYIGKEKLFPGESCTTEIHFLSPEHYPNTLWLGKKIQFQEGDRIVGYATVKEIINETLRKNS